MTKYKRILNIVPSQDTKVWNYKPIGRELKTSLKNKIIYSKEYTITEDQKDTSACVGFSLASGLYRDYLINNNIISPNDKLSSEFIWISSKETDRFTNYPTTFLSMSGTSIQSALDVLRKYGCPTEKEFSSLTKTASEEQFYQIIARNKIKGYVKVTDYKTYLLTKGALVGAVHITESFFNVKKNTILDANFQPKLGGHAICIYGVDISNPLTKYLIKNSWGNNWGDKGFIWVTEKWMRTNLIECYGII
jgi:C1A family cysteine protease